ncbi:hypothetical protein G9A89_003298 [Geosiphon pyriformis]|nr:hypothetical protein G9A89_003298 [Geosiphon pyriformis]
MSDLRNQSAFAYPSPASHLPRTDLSLREILDTYRENNDLLKQILAAKAEEDKRRAEEEKYKTEQLRLQCKQVELEMLREQKKPPTIFTGVPPLNPGYNVKSPSDIHSPYLPIPQPMDPHYSATTPTSATRLSPPSSASNAHDSVSFGSHSGITAPQNHSYHNNINQRPALTLSIPPFPILSPTATHNPHSFSQTPTTLPDQPQSSHSQTSHHHHHQYSQSPTTVTSANNSNNKRPKLAESEVDHEYVMEALRNKVRQNAQNAENPAKKFIKVLKPRSTSMPVPPPNQSPQSNHHQNRQHSHSSPQQHHHQQSHQPQQISSPSNHTPHANSPNPQQLPPMNVHSPQMGQEQVAKS